MVCCNSMVVGVGIIYPTAPMLQFPWAEVQDRI